MLPSPISRNGRDADDRLSFSSTGALADRATSLPFANKRLVEHRHVAELWLSGEGIPISGFGAASPADFSRSWGAHAIPEHLTFPAYLHLAAPAGLRFSLTNGPVDKPAEVARVEFPGGTVAARFQGTLPHRPAGPGLFCFIILQRKQK